MTMAHAKTGGDSPFTTYADLWLGFWRCASIVGGAGLEGVGLFRTIQRPRSQSLTALGRTMDLCMRGPAFLDLVRRGLKLMAMPRGARPWFSTVPPSLPRSLLQRKVPR
jgi:hypothetical protein